MGPEVASYTRWNSSSLIGATAGRTGSQSSVLARVPPVSPAGFTANKPKLLRYENAGGGRNEKPESKANRSCACDHKPRIRVVRVVMYEQHRDTEENEDAAGLNAEQN